MYQAYWGLNASPFCGPHADRYFHSAPTQREALARLHFLVDERRTLGLLLGECGVGKSLVLERFVRQLRGSNRQTANVCLVALDVREFHWSLAAQWGIDVQPDASAFRLARLIDDHLTANRYQQIETVLLLDDADQAAAEVLAEILRLTQCDHLLESRTSIVLAADPRRVPVLGARLLERVELRIDLEPWTAEDTAAYLKTSLATAGRSTPLFTEAAVARLHLLAAGIPRRVKHLADLALLAGAGSGTSQIDPHTIDSVFGELNVASSSEPVAYAR